MLTSCQFIAEGAVRRPSGRLIPKAAQSKLESLCGESVIERVRSGMARARAEGRQIGRARLDVDRAQVIRDRRSGMSLTQVAKRHNISRASVCRLMKEAQESSGVSAFAGRLPEQASAAGGVQ